MSEVVGDYQIFYITEIIDNCRRCVGIIYYFYLIEITYISFVSCRGPYTEDSSYTTVSHFPPSIFEVESLVLSGLLRELHIPLR